MPLAISLPLCDATGSCIMKRGNHRLHIHGDAFLCIHAGTIELVLPSFLNLLVRNLASIVSTNLLQLSTLPTSEMLYLTRYTQRRRAMLVKISARLISILITEFLSLLLFGSLYIFNFSNEHKLTNFSSARNTERESKKEGER